jgi:hypothetical protein
MYHWREERIPSDHSARTRGGIQHDVTAASPWRVIFGGETVTLTGKLEQLVQEQKALLDTNRVLSGFELAIYERRSDQIRELIRLLTDHC